MKYRKVSIVFVIFCFIFLSVYSFGSKHDPMSIHYADESIVLSSNDGKLELFHFQTAPTSATAATWNVVNLDGTAVGQKFANNDTKLEPWDGAVAEMILYKEALSTEDIQAVNAFLTTKWGITAP